MQGVEAFDNCSTDLCANSQQRTTQLSARPFMSKLQDTTLIFSRFLSLDLASVPTVVILANQSLLILTSDCVTTGSRCVHRNTLDR